MKLELSYDEKKEIAVAAGKRFAGADWDEVYTKPHWLEGYENFIDFISDNLQYVLADSMDGAWTEFVTEEDN